MDQVKFVALDRDDLEVVSTHLQDALVKVADVIWRPQEKRLVVGLSRFDWLAAEGTRPELRRCRSALRFERVNCCKCRQVNPAGKDAVLNLLAVEFAETDAPAGVVTLIFSGGGMLRLEVECLEAELADLGPSWPAAERLPGASTPATRCDVRADRPRGLDAPHTSHKQGPGPTFVERAAIDRRNRDLSVTRSVCPLRQAMPIRLDSRAPDFAQRFRALLATKREASADVENAVRAIIADVAARGDRR